MTLEQGAFLAEIVSSVGVIASLIFVGFQVRGSNRESRARAIQDSMRFEMDYTLAFAANPGTWDKVVKSEPLEGEELRLAILLFGAFMCETENRYLQSRMGYIGQEIWDARKGTLVDIKELPLYEHWRRSYSGRNHSPEFLDMMDSLA